MHWLDAYDTDLAADATRLTNRLRDALTGLSPALERVLGPKLHNAGARDLLARYPTPQALATAGHGRIARTLRKRSPRLAKALTEAVTEALDAQTVVVPGSVAMGRVIARGRDRAGSHAAAAGAGSARRSGSSSRPTLLADDPGAGRRSWPDGPQVRGSSGSLVRAF